MITREPSDLVPEHGIAEEEDSRRRLNDQRSDT